MHLYPLLLFAIIVLSLLFLVMTGTGLYSAVVDSQTRNREARAALSYLAARVHAAELDALLPHGTAREGPGVSAVLEGADGRSLSVFAELTADGGYRVIQWQQSAEWAGEAEAPALFGTLREG